MNLEIKIDLEDILTDMFSDESTDLPGYIKDEIVRVVIKTVMPKLQARIDTLVATQIEPVINSHIDVAVLKTLDDLIEKGEMTQRGNAAPIAIKDYVRERFEDHSGWSNPDKKIESLAKKFGDEMKLQYNNYFAMSIVKNLSEQGLLNADVARALLAPPEGE